MKTISLFGLVNSIFSFSNGEFAVGLDERAFLFAGTAHEVNLGLVRVMNGEKSCGCRPQA